MSHPLEVVLDLSWSVVLTKYVMFVGEKYKDGRKSIDADDDATSVMSYESSNVSKVY